MELWVPQHVDKTNVVSSLQDWLDATSKHAYQNIIQDRVNSMYPRLGAVKTLYIVTVTPERQVSITGGVESAAVMCPICHETDREARETLACDHTFHIRCINRWLGSGRNTCPLCRYVVR
jgi:hypothetical protein